MIMIKSSPKRLYDYVFQRSHCDIRDINTSYDYDYDRYAASGNQALGLVFTRT